MLVMLGACVHVAHIMAMWRHVAVVEENNET